MTEPNLELPQEELHHIFVPYPIASQGGTQKVTLRSGKSYEVKIPSNSVEGAKLRLKRLSVQHNDNSLGGIFSRVYEHLSPQYIDNQKDVVIVMHTLFDKSLNIEKIIYKLINEAAIELKSKERCGKIYQSISNAKSTDDLPALNLLDFIIVSSLENSSVSQIYNIASQSYRLLKIEDCLENALAGSNLNKTEKQFIRGTYQCIRAGEEIADFAVLNQLDSIIQNSSLPEELKQLYFRYSVTSRAITADLFIVNLIDSSSTITSSIYRSEILVTYSALRDGKQVSKQANLNLLDLLILDSDIPDDCKIIYKMMREPAINQKGKSKGEDDIFAKVEKIRNSVKKAAGIVPAAVKIASTTGMTAGTGVAISALSGGAATNATLALLGGGSVAAGGLGMLGGLAVATGGAALIGAAALVSVASVAQMDAEDKQKLGFAAGVGVATSAAAVSTAWAAVSAFGVASTGTAISTLSGAAAYSTIMAALGGVGMITGGAAVVAGVAGFAAWKFLKGDKNDPKRILKQLEAKLYS